MSATTTEAARIAGALKCMDALRKLEQSAEEACISDSCDTPAGYYARRLDDSRALVAALGPMAPELEGAFATLAEYIHAEINGGRPNVSPGHWIPLSAMTDAERLAMIERMADEQAADEAETAQRQKELRKVVSIPDWIGAQ